ncbi:MAG: tRNA glutamyl-Q(34) synthetase GluQRS [Deinococcales bacterium]
MHADRPYRGRYAPSPSGWLHLGNARTALAAWLRARRSGGAFVLRVDDLDGPRTVPEAVEGNLRELAWLGLDWDEGPDIDGPYGPYRQSQRGEHYAAALERLRSQGRIFACYLSRRELARIASAPHGRTPVYGPAERQANARIAASKRAEGKPPSLRFRVDVGTVRFEDSVAGPQRFDAGRDVGDVVVRRADGLWAYQLAVVVDDASMQISEVVRGDDLLPSTAAQLLLYDALGWPPPAHAHLPLLVDASGQRLAKRRGSLTLQALRDAGVRPERVVGLLAHGLGLTPRLQEIAAAELVASFDLAGVRRAPARLGADEQAWLLAGAG